MSNQIRKRVHRWLAPLAVTLALLTTACEYVEVDGIGTRTMDEVNPPQSDIASFTGCEPAPLNQWRAVGEVVNQTDKVSTYEVVVAFYDESTRLDERSEWIRDLKPGERAAIDRSWWLDDPSRVTGCQLIMIKPLRLRPRLVM